jgi:hypothetical protein
VSINSYQRQPEPEAASLNTLRAELSPPSTPSSAAGSDTAASVKKSTLNPNAKEFVLNPFAKVFVPGAAAGMSPNRPPISATPPQRPMTPATPNLPLGYGPSPVMSHLYGPGAPGAIQHPNPQMMYPSSPMFNSGAPMAPYPVFQPNASIPVSQSPAHPQPSNTPQRFRGAPNQSPNPIMSAAGQPILTQLPAGSPAQPPNFMPMGQQPHPQLTANMAAVMMNNQAMLMRIHPGSMMMPQQPITSMSGMMDPSGGAHPNMAWMQQQGQASHLPGMPPPHPPNSLPGGPHLAQPPPQPHPSSVANSVQVTHSCHSKRTFQSRV